MSLGVANAATTLWAALNSGVSIIAAASLGRKVLAIYCQRAAKSGLAGAAKPARNSSTKSGRLHTSTISQPASNDNCARALIPPAPQAPSIVRSSEKITPLKPILWRKICFNHTSEKPAGCASICGYTTCAGITAAIPSAESLQKGTISAASSSARLRLSCGNTWWLSPSTKPWPGKCLPQDFMPPLFKPFCKARANSATISALW